MRNVQYTFPQDTRSITMLGLHFRPFVFIKRQCPSEETRLLMKFFFVSND